ncbi:hypothetical protein, partial [Salmonella enterica]|uniref:hypothetical protein n=1 Tax=Salmonella enterica TaxID=28901 RepID=UPI0011EA65FC
HHAGYYFIQIHRYRLFYCGIDPATVSVSRIRSTAMKCKRHDKAFVRALRKAFDLPQVRKAS